MRRGIPIPAPFDDPPEIPFHLAIFATAFRELSEERQYSAEGVHGITRKQINEWAQSYKFDNDSEFMDELFTHIRAIDAVWVAREVKERRRKQRKGGKNGKSPELREETKGVRGRHTATTERGKESASD